MLGRFRNNVYRKSFEQMRPLLGAVLSAGGTKNSRTFGFLDSIHG